MTVRLVVGLAGLLAVMAALVAGSAGTLSYWQAWVFLVLYATVSGAVTVDLLRTKPDLLERRLKGGPMAETEPAQKVVMSVASIAFAAIFVLAGLDRRFGWSYVPLGIVLAGDALHLLGWAGIVAVFRANRFAAATIVVEAGQSVVTTGPYVLVRHPMYTAGLVLLTGIPVALGSWWALLVVAALVPVLVWRLLDEERVLAERLPGYRDYMAKLAWRLVPGVW